MHNPFSRATVSIINYNETESDGDDSSDSLPPDNLSLEYASDNNEGTSGQIKNDFYFTKMFPTTYCYS